MVITVKHVALSTAALVAWNKVGAVVVTVPIIHQALIKVCEWSERVVWRCYVFQSIHRDASNQRQHFIHLFEQAYGYEYFSLQFIFY